MNSLLLVSSRNFLLLWKLKILYYIVTSYLSKMNFNINFQFMCGSSMLSLPCRLSEHFMFWQKYTLCWQQNFKPLTVWIYKSNEWEAVLWKYSVYIAATLSVNIWCLKWFTSFLFAVCNGFSVTFEHPTSNHFNIYVHSTSSVDFIFYELFHISVIWYDMTYLLTAIGSTAGGSSTVHIDTQPVDSRWQ